MSWTHSSGTIGAPYLQAKLAQEKLVRESGIPCSVVRATQFFGVVKNIADSATDGDTVRLPHAPVQPVAADAVARTAVDEPGQRDPRSTGPSRSPDQGSWALVSWSARA